LGHPVCRAIKEYYGETDDPIGISLSGGVDSMVILYCCWVLRYKPIVLHINYGNREESNKEAEFCEFFCGILNVPFHKITMNIYRDSTERSKYEKLTRNIRFKKYGELIETYKIKKGFAVGHHAGDVAENMFTNMMKGRPVLDGGAITICDKIHDVEISRPLYHVFKESIFDFAHKFGIPYFKDTTPDWSNRGILRRQIFPKIKEQYAQYERNMYKMSIDLHDLNDCFQRRIMGPFINTVEFLSNNDGFTVDITEYKDESLMFWQSFFCQVMHKMGRPMISLKQLKHIVDNVIKSSKEIRNKKFILIEGKLTVFM